MASALETRGAKAVVMEAVKLGKLFRGNFAIFLGPLEHGGRKVDVGALAEHADHLLRVVEEVVGVEDGEVVLVGDAALEQKLEEADELAVAGLAGEKVREAVAIAQRREAAAPVRGDGAARVTDEKGKVILAQYVKGQHGRVFGLLVRAHGWGDAGALAVGLHDVVCHVLDEETFSLRRGQCTFSSQLSGSRARPKSPDSKSSRDSESRTIWGMEKWQSQEREDKSMLMKRLG